MTNIQTLEHNFDNVYENISALISMSFVIISGVLTALL